MGAEPGRQAAPSLDRAGDFADALARDVATIEAMPGRHGLWEWSATSAGSVRLVGSFQKQAMTSEAMIDVQVDGGTIWQKKLAATDTIRHAFDIPAYDLAAGSKVSIRVMAWRDPVSVNTNIQILAEPFLSRWRPDLPTGYPSWPEDHRIALRHKGKEILQRIRDASAAKQRKIIIPPGDYLFHADWSRASTLADLENLEIIAAGVTFWFEPPLVHALLFENCRNVTVRGLTIDFTIPCWFQARVTSIDRTAKTIGAALMPGYDPRGAKGEPETGGKRAIMFYDAAGRFINHRHSPGTWQLDQDGKNIVCSNIALAGIPAALKAGDFVVGTIRTGAALRSTNCYGMRFEDINIWSSPGMAVNETGGAGGNIYQRVRATRRPHSNRLHAFGADIFHLAGTDRGPTLDRCELAYGADDNLNIHGSFGVVVQRVDASHYHMQGAYAAGDTIEFRDHQSVALFGRAKVVSAKQTDSGPSIRINDKHQAIGQVLVALDNPLELPPLSLVVMDGKHSSAGFVVRDCWLHDNFQRTLINGSPGGLIENNTLLNVGHGLVIQFETWGPWMEGPFARDLIIRGNRFLDSPPDGPAIVLSMHPPGGGSNTRRFDAKPVTNLTITGNDFARTSTTPIVLHNVDGVSIHDNSLDFPGDAPPHAGLANSADVNWLYLQDCGNVSVKDNLSQAPAADDPSRPRTIETPQR